MGSSLLYISIAYYMQKGGGWVQITCKIAYVINGRSPRWAKRIQAIQYCRTSNIIACRIEKPGYMLKEKVYPRNKGGGGS